MAGKEIPIGTIRHIGVGGDAIAAAVVERRCGAGMVNERDVVNSACRGRDLEPGNLQERAVALTTAGAAQFQAFHECAADRRSGNS